MPLLLKYFLAWFPMLLLAIANGAVRDLIYKQYTGDLLAHQLSTVSLIVLFGLYIRYVVSRIHPESAMQAILMGVFWVVLTLMFEFGFGRYRGNSWENLLADYNILKGRLWILIPLWVGVAPFLFYKLAEK
jgi:hypothetical protein